MTPKINHRLRAARIQAGMTLSSIARAAGMHMQTYRGCECSGHEIGVNKAIRIADALGVTDLRELFGDERPQDRDD